MQVYEAPLRDMRFVLHELHTDDGFGNIAHFAEITPDVADAVLDEAAKIAREVLLPINASGDIEGVPNREWRRPHARGLQGGL